MTKFAIVSAAVCVAAWSGLAYGAITWYLDRLDDLEQFIAPRASEGDSDD